VIPDRSAGAQSIIVREESMKKLSVALALVVFAAPAFAFNGIRLTGFSPTNASMGGAGAALALDSSALVLNPATMADLGSRADFGAAYVSTDVSYSATNNYIGTGVPALEGLGRLIVNQPNVTLKSDFPAVPVPNIGIIIPFGKEIRLGIGMASVAGVGTDYAANLFSSVVESRYLSFRFPIGMSYSLMDGALALGATLNPAWAMMGYSLGASVGLPPHLGVYSFGFGFSLGVKYSIMKNLSVGVNYESPTWFQPYKFNIGCANPLGAFPPPQPGCPITGGLAGGQEELQFNLPWNVSGGFALTLMDEMILVLGDVQYLAWSTTLGQGQPAFVNNSATATSASFPFSTDWKDQWVFKIGVQVAPVDWMKVRVGFNYGEAPVNPNQALENIAFPAIVASHLTLGLGFDISKSMAINLASVIGFSNSVTGTGPLPDLSGIAGQPLPPGTLTATNTVSGYSLEAGLSMKY
jgi:long-chain fatty acid transport protein